MVPLRGIAAVAALSVALGAPGAAPAATRWVDPTEVWSSPGAIYIARQLNQIDPRWGVTAAGLDQFERDWCFANNPQQLSVAVNRLIMLTTPGADLRTLPALSQMLQLIEQSCIAQGGNPPTVDYWIQITANYMMTVVRDNTRREIQAQQTAWTPPVPQTARTSLRSSVVSGACSAVVNVGGNALVGRYTRLAGLKTMGLFSVAKWGCNKLVNALWSRVF
jgi:hypothetical protein